MAAQGLAAQGFAAQGLAAQGFAAHGFAAHGFAAAASLALRALRFSARTARAVLIRDELLPLEKPLGPQGIPAAAGALVAATARPPATTSILAIDGVFDIEILSVSGTQKS